LTYGRSKKLTGEILARAGHQSGAGPENVERWRHDYRPLERFLPGPGVLAEWPIEVTGYPEEEMKALQASGSAWLLTFKAVKRSTSS